jgi:hypothetical protein
MYRIVLGAAALSASLAFVACGRAATVCDYGACEDPYPDASADGAMPDGGGGDVVTPPGCGTDDPRDNAKCVTDDAGIFVSLSGDDGNAGNKAKPVQTIRAAITLAAQKGGRVFACEGEYKENISVKDTVQIFGGFNCVSAARAPWLRPFGCRRKLVGDGQRSFEATLSRAPSYARRARRAQTGRGGYACEANSWAQARYSGRGAKLAPVE